MSNTLAIAMFILGLAMVGVLVISVTIYQLTLIIIQNQRKKIAIKRRKKSK